MRNLVEESRPEQLITLPKRGIRVIAPEHTASVMSLAKKHLAEGTRFTTEEKEALWPEEEKTRIRILANCSILKKRYPTSEAGKNFMREVDYVRRDELLNTACDLTLTIASEWQKINPRIPIAVVLFGSVAKGLVKREDHPDPSNIDLTIIGDINADERNTLFNAIRPAREKIREDILSRVPHIDSQEYNPGNPGVFIQNTEKITKEGYAQAKNYIASGAFALYDPENVWANVETDALKHAADKFGRTNNRRKPKLVFSAPRS